MSNLFQSVQFIYFITAFLLIFGLKMMSSPRTAKQGIIFAGCGMLVAIFVTFFITDLHNAINFELIIAAILIGSAVAWYSGKKVLMINMPQMIALYNGMGGGAAAAIAALELLKYDNPAPLMVRSLAVLGAIIGTLSFSGSIMAFAKLQDLIERALRLPGHQIINILLAVAILCLAVLLAAFPEKLVIIPIFFALLIILGITFTMPIGGANMPVVISLFNAMTGLAVAFNGYVLNNSALIVAGTVVGASGTLLTQLMAKAMHKTLFSIIFAKLSPSQQQGAQTAAENLKPIEIEDAAVMLAYANKVIIVPGYGMAVAQAQYKIWELTQQLEQRGVDVKFAIHPVAGRMPGHMNVLLAEAGVPYEKIYDLEDINAEFANCDVALVIGANDVVNPAARNEPNSPIYGMPILNVADAKNVLVIKRGQGKGFSGVENSLFTMDNTHMLYGSGQDVASKLVQSIKTV